MSLLTDRPNESRTPKLLDKIRRPADHALLGETLKAKFFRGGVWLGAGSFLEQVVRFARNLVLTRLLAPEAFGTMALVLSAGSVIHTITDMGVKEAIIQNPKGAEDRYASAAWWLGLGRALSLYVVIFLLAPLLSRFYGNAELVPLLRIVTLGVVFDGALSSRAYIALKDMKFGKWALINHGGAILGVVVTVSLSFLIRNVWALVLGSLAESAARCGASYILCPYHPSISLDFEAAHDLLRFSKKLFGMSLLNLVFARTDVFVLAKLYSPTDLGLYVMAIYIVQTPMSFIMNLLTQTLLPTFSKIQGQEARVNRILLQVTALLITLGIPTFVFVVFSGRALLTLSYGQRYATAAAPLVVASAVALINILNGQITTVFFARGTPQLHRRCVAILAVVMMALIYPSVKRFGLVGGQVACLAAMLTGFGFQLARVRNLTHLDLVQYFRPLLLSAALSALAAVIFVGARRLGMIARPLPNIVFGVCVCFLAYGAAYMISTQRPKHGVDL